MKIDPERLRAATAELVAEFETQTELADTAGVTQTMIAYILAGKRRVGTKTWRGLMRAAAAVDRDDLVNELLAGFGIPVRGTVEDGRVEWE
jgi:predicted transcriptional regulator